MATRTYRDGTVWLVIPKATALELYTRANVYLLYGECYSVAGHADDILRHAGDLGIEVGRIKDILKQYDRAKDNDTRTILQPRGQNARGTVTLRQAPLRGTARGKAARGESRGQRDSARKGHTPRKAEPKTVE